MADTEDGASAASAKGHSDARERCWSEIAPELRPYVDRSLARHAWRSSAIRARNAARWREARAQPLERLDAEALLARTEARILAFWRGDRDEDAAPASWPLNDAQRAAIRRATDASSASERLCAIADTLGCWKAELRHREALETLRFENVGYEGWDEAEAHFRALEALARRLQNLGL